MENGQESPAPKATGKAVLLLTLALILNGTALFVMGLIESRSPPWLSESLRMGAFGFYMGISLAELVGVWLWTRTYAPSLSFRGGQGALLSALVAICSYGWMIIIVTRSGQYAQFLIIILLGWFIYGLLGLMLSGSIRVAKLRGQLQVPNSQTFTTHAMFSAMFFTAVVTLMIKEIATCESLLDRSLWFRPSPSTIQEWVYTLSMLTAAALGTAYLAYLKVADTVFKSTRKYKVALVLSVLILPLPIHMFDRLISPFLGLPPHYSTTAQYYVTYLMAELSLILGLRLVIGLIPINRAVLA